MNKFGLLLFAATALAAAGCGNGSSTADMGGGACDASTYPCTNLGRDVGKTIPNLAIAGTQPDDNDNGNPLDDAIRNFKLEEYHKDTNLKVLVILTAAEWCVPCQNEQADLVELFNTYNKGLPLSQKRVAFLEAILQKADLSPAEASNMANWATKFKLPFDVTYDATGSLAPYYDAKVFPSQVVICTKDMKITYMNNGYIPGALKQAIDEALKDCP